MYDDNSMKWFEKLIKTFPDESSKTFMLKRYWKLCILHIYQLIKAELSERSKTKISVVKI